MTTEEYTGKGETVEETHRNTVAENQSRNNKIYFKRAIMKNLDNITTCVMTAG